MFVCLGFFFVCLFVCLCFFFGGGEYCCRSGGGAPNLDGADSCSFVCDDRSLVWLVGCLGGWIISLNRLSMIWFEFVCSVRARISVVGYCDGIFDGGKISGALLQR